MPNLTAAQVAAQLGVSVEVVRKRAQRVRSTGKRCGVKVGSVWVYGVADRRKLGATQ